MILGSISSCSSARKRTHPAPLLPGMTADSKGAKALSEEPDEEPSGTPAPAAVESEILKFEETVDSQQLEKEASDASEDAEDDLEPAPVTAPRKHQIPFEFNQSVAGWIAYFSQKDHERFQRFLDRAEPYREAVENILEENGVPADLYYLGLIESGFVVQAKSHAKAVGVWQFMRSTGKLYGLGVDSYVDERKDPIRATEAAAKLLRDLYREFKSWYLAMAAYNAGLGRIRGAVRRGHTNDFWELVRLRVLPRETMDYVPKFLAARYIGENPDVFAFYINEEKKYPDVQLVKVPSPVRFDSIEHSCSIPSGTLSFVNPHYLKAYTHPGRKVDEIWVPTAYQASVESNFQKLSADRIRVRPEKTVRTVSERLPVYVVRKGDTLRSIARKQGLSVAYLKQVNGLKSAKVSAGQKLKLAATSYSQKRTHPRRHRRRKSR